MSTPSLFDAFELLRQFAQRGSDYSYDKVFRLEEPDPVTAGSGFDLARTVSVSVDGARIETAAELRILALVTGNLLVRLWLEWISPFGLHRSYAYYNLSHDDLCSFAALTNVLESDEPEASLDPEELEVTWKQIYPRFSRKILEYHESAVQAARAAEPKLLGMLSADNSGTICAQQIVNLYEWLKEQPEMSSRN